MEMLCPRWWSFSNVKRRGGEGREFDRQCWLSLFEKDSHLSGQLPIESDSHRDWEFQRSFLCTLATTGSSEASHPINKCLAHSPSAGKDIQNVCEESHFNSH
jgi:hypothetical protein